MGSDRIGSSLCLTGGLAPRRGEAAADVAALRTARRYTAVVHSECSDHEVSVETTKSQKHHLKKRARLEMRLRRPVIHKDSAILVLNKPTKVPMKGNLPVHNSMDVLAAAALFIGSGRPSSSLLLSGVATGAGVVAGDLALRVTPIPAHKMAPLQGLCGDPKIQ
uniref:Uncharacterized protein n=1 Tax=Oryza glumipatula TaxID=40148 RepID=A0A0E0B4X3_9ORYZ